MASASTHSLYDGSKVGWFQFEDDLKSKLQTVGAKSMVFAATNAQRRQPVVNNLAANANEAAIARYQINAKTNELFESQQTKGIDILFSLITRQLQTELNDIEGLAAMFDHLVATYKPQMGANNVWSDDNVEAIKSLIHKPILPEERFKPHWDRIVQLNDQLGNQLPGAYWYIIQDLKITLLPQKEGDWTRWIQHLADAEKQHKTGEALIQFLEECDDHDQNAFRLGKGPKSTTTTNTVVSKNVISTPPTPEMDPAMALPLGAYNQQAGRGNGGRRGGFQGRGGGRHYGQGRGRYNNPNRDNFNGYQQYNKGNRYHPYQQGNGYVPRGGNDGSGFGNGYGRGRGRGRGYGRGRYGNNDSSTIQQMRHLLNDKHKQKDKNKKNTNVSFTDN